MIDSVSGVDAARKERLIKVLDIDPNWRMHQVGPHGHMQREAGSPALAWALVGCCREWQRVLSRTAAPLGCPDLTQRTCIALCSQQVSDGQRRRVQICVGLLRPFKVRGEGLAAHQQMG